LKPPRLKRQRRLAFTTLATLTLGSLTASAEPSMWQPHWPKFRPAEIAFTAGSTVQVAMATFLFHPAKRNFEGGILFDEAVRDGIRLRTRDGRTAAATVSDMMYYALLAYPLLDAPIVAKVRGDSDTAVQTLAINFESYAVAGAYAIAAEKLGRARPMAGECDRDPSYDRRCSDTDRLNTGNVSGHTALAFTGAGLACAHHLHLPLYGGGAADVTACVASVTLAATSGVLRVMSDNHYTTDVLLGAALGLGSGYLLPRLLHYRSRPGSSQGTARSFLPSFHSRESGLTVMFAPSIVPAMMGVSVHGML
jgi:membrane-associated phospholipid phosphatase